MNRFFLSTTSAVLMGIAQQPWGFGFLAWFSLVPFLFLLEKEKKIKNIIIYSFLWSFIYHFIFFHWLSENIGLDSQLHRYLTLLIVIFVLSVNILFIYLSYYYLKKHIKIFIPIYLLPFLITATEYIRSLGLYGSAWNSLSYSQVDYLLISQNIEYTGIFGLTFWIVLINVSIYQLIDNLNKKYIILLIIIFVMPWISGTLIKWSYNDNYSSLNIKVIQPNVSLYDKRENIMNSIERMIELSTRTSNDSVSLIIWPESSISGRFIKDLKYNKNISESMNNFLRSNDFSVIAGLDLKNKDKRYNAAALFKSDSLISIYNKQKLVPHVEHTPAIFDKVGLNIIPMTNFDIGKELSIFNVDNINFASMVCIESVFSNPTRSFINKGAEFIVYIVNDAWYPGNPQLEQHARRCIYRSIEHRKSVVRCANTGITMIVNPYGNITDKLEFNKEGIIEANIVTSTYKTFYTKYGDLFSIFNIVFLIVTVLFSFVRNFYRVK
tara:strand:+ start:6879 stop:8360 length:1482 start_codon:yes stop_codon:yes gene_type:complete